MNTAGSYYSSFKARSLAEERLSLNKDLVDEYRTLRKTPESPRP